MVPTPGLERLAADALIVLLHLAAALAHIREGDTGAALNALTELTQGGPAVSEMPYGAEALYWRARLGEVQDEREAALLYALGAAILALRRPVPATRAQQGGPT